MEDEQQQEENEFTNQQAESLPQAFQQEGELFLPRGAALPTDVCVCCTRNPRKIFHKALRNPKNPGTWFGRTTSLDIGLCKIHKDRYHVALALTFSLLILGIIIVLAGILTLSFTTILLGLIPISVSGFFRARMPITSPNPRSELIEIHGAGAVMLSRIPVVNPVDVNFST